LTQRNEGFRELLKSERSYVKNLKIIVEEYLVHLRDMLSKKALGITHGDVAAMFSNVELLLEVHSSFLEDFEKLNEQWPSLDTIGKVFLKMVHSPFICP
jgi:hypothetical protein